MNKEKIGSGEWGDLLFTFVLLNRGIPDVKTICINRTKEIDLFTEITRCVGEQERWSDLFRNK